MKKYVAQLYPFNQNRWLPYSALNILHQAYRLQIKPQQHRCLTRLENDWRQRQPLAGKTVLVNMHLTLITLAVIRILAMAGATVEITRSPELVAHENTLSALAAAGVPLLPAIPGSKHVHYYDIIYNCGGGDRRIIPRLGEVELTHTPAEWYQNITFPVITVDRSHTKDIETGFGTGESIIRVLRHLNPHAAGELFLQQKTIMIFGYGKVGQGLAHALEKAGGVKSKLIIIEKNPFSAMTALQHGYHVILLERASPLSKDLPAIQRLIFDTDIVITATGVEAAVSQMFQESDFRDTTLLINMGTTDEFGPRFSPQRIVNHKKPANFMLPFPTAVHYLDPIMSLLIQAGAELTTQLAPGLQPVSPALDQAILYEWMKYQGDALWRAASAKQSLKYSASPHFFARRQQNAAPARNPAQPRFSQ